MSGYGYQVEVAEGHDEAVLRARLALRAEGFSILTEMDVTGMLGAQAGTERQHLFMGAWDTKIDGRRVMSHSASSEGEAGGSPSPVDVGVHFACNLVVQEQGSSAVVAALDPEEAIDTNDSESLRAAQSAREALQRVLSMIRSPSDGSPSDG